jgi:ATP-binding cassette subfamily A (ABC1) protein 3
LGIMVRGNFRCMGTPQHIKTKYGEGYELEIKVMVPSHESLIKMIRRGNMSEGTTSIYI